MRKTIIVIFCSLPIFSLLGQVNSIRIGSNLGKYRQDALLGYQFSNKNWNFNYTIGFGKYGSKKNEVTEKSGYGLAYQPLVLTTGYFKRHGSKHNFRGFSSAIDIERRLFTIKSVSLYFGIGFSYYPITDRFEYYYTITPDDSDIQTLITRVKGHFASIDPELLVYYKISDKINLKFGFRTPIYFNLIRKLGTYQAWSPSYPLSGIEPMAQIGITYNLTKP